jgi:malonyl-CoA/methylmalonyl-CoA synthetase
VVAVVIGQPDRMGDEAAMIAQCRRQLAPYKSPKRIVVVDALPRNTMGKVQKNQLRERFASLFMA